ncbi:HAMP domain-containing histidine kinase [Aggregatimonas sangjinii]|uniref:histidine kinase n=1 Tax=Aggregatimonas sangjinii TaxID=2583587 RepID=A0A5B7SWN4_9FLAO|nr:HAMP domain-containing sensor histidine kinase [Aggregatimonas sangjinii]QCX01749.1 HAMP domain-containing histidine kinase [Aggregatimonas sangjinii]
MKQRINILIITAIVTLFALMGIQAYLIYNTYELKKKSFLNETKKALNKIDDATPDLLDLENLWAERLVELLVAYKYEDVSKENFVAQLTRTSDSIGSRYNVRYQQEVQKTALGYEVGFKKNLIGLVILDSVANDTVVPLNDGEKIRLVGGTFDDELGYQTKTTSWQSTFYEEKKGVPYDESRDFEFMVITENRMNISEWNRIVLGSMAGLLTASGILLLFVVGLFYYSIKNLIKQKKVAEVKTDFIDNITHELKTPLATLSIASKSLRKKEILENPEAFGKTVGIVERQNSRLQKLIDQVMTNSLGSEELVLNKEQVIDDTYFKNLIDDFSLSVQSQDLTIHQHIEPREILLRIDSFLFTTALFNILENAVKYGKESIAITLTTQLKNNHYEIIISDNGTGISAKDQKFIFDKFFRIAAGNIHNVKGLGLGLYYTKQVIDAHEGTISCKSEMNKGTIFTITIPVN